MMLPVLADDYDGDKAIFGCRLTLDQIIGCSGKRVCLDTETNGLEWYRDNKIIGCGFYCPDATVEGYYPATNDAARADVRAAVSMWGRDTTVIAHNLKFDLHFMDLDPNIYGWRIIDTTVLVHLIDSRSPKKLVEVEKLFLGTDSKRSHLYNAPKGLPIWEWPVHTVADYCRNDAKVEYQLAEKLIPTVRDLQMLSLFQKEMEYLKALYQMEQDGLLLDVEFMDRAIARMANDRNEALKELFAAIGYEFNFGSTTQLSKALYNDYPHDGIKGWPRPQNPFADADGVDRTRFAMRGKYNSTLTDSFILMEKAHHPLGELVLHIRETDKLGDKLAKMKSLRNLEAGTLHTTYNQNGTRTGRLSSSEPNVQNLQSEIRSRAVTAVFSGDRQHRIEEYNLRRCIIARPGHTFLSIDYKQMEMRMFGILAQEPKMLESLKSGRDIHGDVAEMVWHSRDEVHREWSKTIGFGLIYGMTTGSLQFRLNMEREEAINVTDQYWGTFPRIKPWLREMIKECGREGFVRYWSGRIWREDQADKQYKSANAVIQGGCADLISIAAIRCARWLDGHPDFGRLLMQVHDELVFEIRDEHLDEAERDLSQIMMVPDLLALPFFTDSKVGKTYGTLEKLVKVAA